MYGEWRPYVSVATQRAKAQRFIKSLKSKGKSVFPIQIEGRLIAKTFWGKAWCENLESYSDFSNRLPRGRRYVRNGSVIDLQIARGTVAALVSGSDIYEVEINIKATPRRDWSRIKQECSGNIDSLIDLLQGRFSDAVMKNLTRQNGGLFPKPADIQLDCSCPDWAHMCKHVAAVLYGIGARLDADPELLFVLRDVDHLELISQASDASALKQSTSGATTQALDADDLGELFGIDLDTGPADSERSSTTSNGKRGRRKRTVRSDVVAAATTAKVRGQARGAKKKQAAAARPKRSAKKSAKKSARSGQQPARAPASGRASTQTNGTKAVKKAAKPAAKKAAKPTAKKATRKKILVSGKSKRAPTKAAARTASPAAKSTKKKARKSKRKTATAV